MDACRSVIDRVHYKVLADNSYDFSGNIKDGDFSLHRHTEQLVQ